jgi:hypothetical protein
MNTFRQKDIGDFEYTDVGFSFINKEKKIVSWHWADIESIFAYKNDLFTVDQLCLDIFNKSDGYVTLTEDVPGWAYFIEKLKAIFPGIDKEFDWKIVLPPFATNLTLVYDRYNRDQKEVERICYSK